MSLAPVSCLSRCESFRPVSFSRSFRLIPSAAAKRLRPNAPRKKARLRPQWTNSAFLYGARKSRRLMRPNTPRETSVAEANKEFLIMLPAPGFSFESVGYGRSFSECLVFAEVADREPERIHEDVFIRNLVAKAEKQTGRVERLSRDRVIGGPE